MKPIAIFVAGDPVPAAQARRGGFDAMIRQRVGAAHPGPWQVIDLRTAHQLPTPEQLAGAIVSGSASSVTDREDWTQRGEAMLRALVARAVPTLGICYGHQMLGQALGGRVQKNPRGREMGTVRVEMLHPDPLLAPQPGRDTTYLAHATHVDSVVELPPGAHILARTGLEPYAAIRFAPSAWGVQYHPEFDAEVMRDYVQARLDQLQAERLDAAGILAAIADTPVASAVLERFVQAVRRPI